MPEYGIQFQKGLSLASFLRRFGTESQCVDTLERWRWPQGVVCLSSGHGRHRHACEHRLLQCRHCHNQTSVSAGTIFASA